MPQSLQPNVIKAVWKRYTELLEAKNITLSFTDKTGSKTYGDQSSKLLPVKVLTKGSKTTNGQYRIATHFNDQLVFEKEWRVQPSVEDVVQTMREATPRT